MSKQQPWTIILLVYVGSIADLIGLTNTNDKRSRDRYNVELRFRVYYISAGQTSLLQIEEEEEEEGWFGQPKYSTLYNVILRCNGLCFSYHLQNEVGLLPFPLNLKSLVFLLVNISQPRPKRTKTPRRPNKLTIV